jgi:hypothetical protein
VGRSHGLAQNPLKRKTPQSWSHKTKALNLHLFAKVSLKGGLEKRELEPKLLLQVGLESGM